MNVTFVLKLFLKHNYIHKYFGITPTPNITDIFFIKYT